MIEATQFLTLANQHSSAPSFRNLRIESQHWTELDELDKAVAVLEILLYRFRSDAEHRTRITQFVQPIWRTSTFNSSRSPMRTPVAGSSAGTGSQALPPHGARRHPRDPRWVQGTAADIGEVPGAGVTKEDFAAALDTLNAMLNTVPDKWTCEWYELKFLQAYGYYRWATAEGGPRDSKYNAVAKRLLNSLVQQLGADFKGLPGASGVTESCELEERFANRLGKEILRRRFVWLWGKVRAAK